MDIVCRVFFDVYFLFFILINLRTSAQNVHIPFVTKVAKFYKNERTDELSNYSSYYSTETRFITSGTGE